MATVMSCFPAWPNSGQLGDRSVQVEFAAIGQKVDARACQRLGAGEDAGERVFLPGPQAGGVGRAAPEVDGQFAVHPDGDRGADLVAFEEVVFEGIADLPEAGGARTADGDARRVGQRSS
jgi:hypothetical protein